jgi:spermidine synthase
MFGLVLGSWAMNGWLRRSEARPADRRPGLRTLAGLDLAMTVFAACLVLAMGALRLCATDWLVQAATFALVAAAGVLGGLVFPLATAVALEDRPQTGRAAGAVDAADNFGACLGAMATGVVLVPILGTSGACLLVAAVKALSALWVGVAATISPQAARAAPPSASA